ncbi:ring-1,2-phenylacetyl-CoA epoxidase subunit PaaD [Psychrobacter sp. LV10R520-6]|nr:ring-1,2-phenylacetyl-CoA epoxidase subunit PaaD [Psychrobacter sp. LV10R520-6]
MVETNMTKIQLTPMLDIDEIMQILAEVPDPEVPVLTLDDLGIIRDVNIDQKAGTITVTLTPTYIGCPATAAIRKMVSDALIDAGYPEPILKEQLVPAWSTDWMSPEAIVKLETYGIAPPGSGDSNEPKRCPNCGSNDYQVVSHFGATACKSLYRCLECTEPFEYFKCH